MPKSFSKKIIEVNIRTGERVKTFTQLATETSISKNGLPDKGEAKTKIYGLSYETLEEMTTLSFRHDRLEKHEISILAGDENGLSLAFAGEITNAWADFNMAPDVPLLIDAMTGAYPSLIASPQLAINGESSADKVMNQLANEMGYSFVNEGVTASLKNTILSGSPVEKAQKVARQLGIDLIIDDQTMIILPAGQVREGNIVFLSPATGLIGYPTFGNEGIVCKGIYNPDLKYGSMVSIESIVPRATGQWKITKLDHNLSTNPANDAWESSIEASYVEN